MQPPYKREARHLRELLYMTDGSISQQNIIASGAQSPVSEISASHAMSTNGGSSLSATEQYPSHQRDNDLPNTAGLARRLQGGPTEDDIVEALREGLDKCLDVFFGTHDRAGKDDMVQPQAGHWSQCRFSDFCDCMTRAPLPKGTAADPEERDLDLFYNILYAVLMHLLQEHPDRRRVIREVRYRMTDVTVQRNKVMLQVKRAHNKEEGAKKT